MRRKQVESPLMDVAETAAYVKRTEDYVRRVLRYRVPVVQNGKRGKLYFFKTDLDRDLAACTHVPVK
jgi:hypothetical protein